MSRTLRCAVVTPARNERFNLPALRNCIERQTARPEEWLIVDDGSTDGTFELAQGVANEHPWVRVLQLETTGPPERGGAVVRSFTAGVNSLVSVPDIIIKMDADVTFGDDYIERLLAAFSSEPGLGIASGICHELNSGDWRPLFGTRSHVWGATRAYRRACLEFVTPLDEREGWDDLDALKARLEGWQTGVIADLPFRHHRKLGQRDGATTVWLRQGEVAYYMGYRFPYLVARTLYRFVREPRAALMLLGWTTAALRRRPRVRDARVREYLRDQQRLRNLRLRARETRGVVSRSQMGAPGIEPGTSRV
jgi:biofilm PGA synthesis N-glycosyltransferase PgaC